ncbi:MAG: hypothetical protein Fur0043_22840 [Anaerolineales bacterium]
MKAAFSSSDATPWRALANLGEQLVSAPSLAAQRDRILAMTRRLVAGEIEVWLDESLFRLPDGETPSLFPPEPAGETMQAALQSSKPVIHTCEEGAVRGQAAFPLEEQGLVLGVLQISRTEQGFSQDELDLLEALSDIVSVGLFASHRAIVERFRLNQLNLVREVSAQISNVMDVDELARRVTESIQKTFHYYYVALFSLEPGKQKLRFLSAASSGRRKKAIALDVELGQGLIGQAALSGKREVVDDVRADPRFRFVPSLPGTRSEVVLPLKLEDRILGVLDVQSDQLQGFHPNDVLILDALAANVARAIEGARLYSDLRRRAEQLALVAEVSEEITATLNLSEVLHRIVSLIHARFGYPFVHIFTVHPNRRQIIYEAGSGARSRNLEGYSIRLNETSGIIPWVAREGESVLTNDVSREPRYAPSPFPPRNTRSELCVPLLFDQQVIGVLDVQSDRLNAFTQDDLLLFETVAGHIASAIHNAELYSSEQWRRQVADGLREVAVLLSANVGVEEVLDAILTQLDSTLPVDISAIWLLDGGNLYLASVHGCDAEALERARLTSPDAAVAMMSALISEEPLIRQPADAIGPSGLAAGFPPDYSSIAAPLRVGDRPVGVLTLAHRTPGRYGHEARSMVTTFASYAAVAIENARLYDAAQEQAYASAALLQVAQAVVSLNDLEDILGAIVRITPILVGVDWVALYLWDAENAQFYPYEEYGLPEEDEVDFWEKKYSSGVSPLLDAVRARGELLVLPVSEETRWQDWAKSEALDQAAEREARAGSLPLLIAAPLLIKSDFFGVLLALESPRGLRFRERRLEMINGVAQQAALAIQSDRLQDEKVLRERLETEVQLARQIQQTFIPATLPTRPGWDLAARWWTARQVGGDFYDVLELPGGRLGLFIADVADKGIPAALFMALTRTLVRAAVSGGGSPALALRRVNDLLIPDTRQGMFVTAVYAVLDPQTGQLVYANAGHNPPLCLRRQGNLERLTRTGMALGVLEGTDIEEHALRLESGDCLLFYTDGLSEAFSPRGEQFGEGRILTALQSAQTESAERILERIEEHLMAFVEEEEQADDLTMLLVRRV